MRAFLAGNPKQLDLCLKLLYAENVGFSVAVQESAKRKIEYSISVEVSEQKFDELWKKYRILIS